MLWICTSVVANLEIFEGICLPKMQKWIKWPWIYSVSLKMIKESVHQSFWIPSVFFSRCEHGIIEKCTPTSNTKCREGNYFFLRLYSPFSQPHCKIWRKVNPKLLILWEYFVLILKIAYFHLPCPVFQSTGSRSNLHSLWALLILIPISALIYRGKFLLCSNCRLK